MAKYTCPMHPEVISNEPGVCPKCNMNLVSDDTEDETNGDHDHSNPSATWRLRRLNDHRTTNMTITTSMLATIQTCLSRSFGLASS